MLENLEGGFGNSHLAMPRMPPALLFAQDAWRVWEPAFPNSEEPRCQGEAVFIVHPSHTTGNHSGRFAQDQALISCQGFH